MLCAEWQLRQLFTKIFAPFCSAARSVTALGALSRGTTDSAAHTAVDGATTATTIKAIAPSSFFNSISLNSVGSVSFVSDSHRHGLEGTAATPDWHEQKEPEIDQRAA